MSSTHEIPDTVIISSTVPSILQQQHYPYSESEDRNVRPINTFKDVIAIKYDRKRIEHGLDTLTSSSESNDEMINCPFSSGKASTTNESVNKKYFRYGFNHYAQNFTSANTEDVISALSDDDNKSQQTFWTVYENDIYYENDCGKIQYFDFESLSHSRFHTATPRRAKSSRQIKASLLSRRFVGTKLHHTSESKKTEKNIILKLKLDAIKPPFIKKWNETANAFMEFLRRICRNRKVLIHNKKEYQSMDSSTVPDFTDWSSTSSESE